MKRKRMKMNLQLTVSLLLAFVICNAAFAVEPVESDFFTDTIDQVSQTVNLVTDYGADGSDALDDSVVLQTAIDDMTLNPNGGKIIIPDGTFYFQNVDLKSNVHLEIDPGATLKPNVIGGTIFEMGLDRNGVNALTVISNTSIRASSGRYTVDLTTIPADERISFVLCRNVDNFMIADFNIIETYTMYSAIALNPAAYETSYFRARNGVIKNGHDENAHYGYGLIQAQMGYNILFKDLSGTGGVTLRMESGADETLAAPAEFNFDQIYARNISVTNGHEAIMMGDHGRVHGYVDVDGVRAVSSSKGVGIGELFADSCIIQNVHVVFGTNAQHKTKNFPEIAPQDRHLISTNACWWEYNIYLGPSATAVIQRNPNVTVSNVTTEGFGYLPNSIGTQEPYESLNCLLTDLYIGCNPIPVDGVAISESTLSLQSAQTALLTATVSPADATDQEVNWTTDDPAVAIVSENGKVLATGPGTCTITGRTVDWGYPATCQVTVFGTAAGSWTELTNDDFESGWGNWVSGGADAFLSTDTNGAIGAQCVNLQDDSSTAHMDLFSSLDLTGYAFLKIGFSLVSDGFDEFEYMAVEFSDDGGATWVTADNYLNDFEFENGERIELEVLIDDVSFSFTSDVKIRIRCNSSWDAEIAYIDNVVISALDAGASPVNNAPAFASDPVVEADATESETYSSSIADDASDPDGDFLTFSATAGPSWLNVASDGALSGTPSNSDLGLNSWIVEVDDGKGGTDSATLEIAVAEPAPDTADADLPVVGTVSGSYADTQAQDDVCQSITEIYSGLKSQIDHVWEFNLGAGNSLFKVDAYYADSGDADSGFTFSWGTDTAGPWTDMVMVTKTADNDSYQAYDMGSVSGTIYIRVIDNDRTRKESGLDTLYIDHMVVEAGGGVVNNPPSFDSDPVVEANAKENAAYSSSIADDASDPDSDPLTFSKVSGPSWLTVASDGSLSGTPAASDVGLNSFTVEVDDGNGGIASATLEITVDAESGGDPLPGEASSPSPVSKARDIPTSGVTLSWTAGSDAVSHNVYFGTVSGSPTFMGNQTGTTFDPGTLVNKEVYYWRIDEVNAAGTTTGTQWSFTTVR